MSLNQEQLGDVRAALMARRDALGAELRGEATRAREDTFGDVAGEFTDRASERLPTSCSMWITLSYERTCERILTGVNVACLRPQLPLDSEFASHREVPRLDALGTCPE
jgi:hypothetical protein